ncbi:uncharacterized protein (DUF58 family) [Microbacterium ginsengiterrae]|uniref:Uncharacterized protein (DUF58 family) n=1 Tax=Microbacterium ginsengiterrae TaxID=546115 RepID=A0A7W9FAB3_9MICO|nr:MULTISPECIES: DUF58 domain-containing protein [Microbacterium]MBB5742076.1 uncharacterized protein (DUF58 family) [Microbacterium ginsengiterrae]
MRPGRPLTGRGVAALLTGVGCAIAANVLAAPILLYVAVLLFALVIVAVVAVRAPRRGGAVTRRISTDLLTVGEESQVAVRFDLRALRIPLGTWRDALPSAVTGDAEGDFPTDNGTSIRYRITGARRGVWPIGPLSLHTIDPFGLAQRVQEFGDTRTVTVVPEVVPLAPMSRAAGAAGGTAHTATSRLGQGSDNLSPRRYVSGDSMRRIHWRATAHRGDLMVRQEEEEASPDAVVILDRAARRWSPHTGAVDPAFETAVAACASIALHLVQEGYNVDVRDSAGTVLGVLRGQEDDRDSLLVVLAMVQPQGEGRDVVTLLDGTPPGPLVMITGRIDEPDAAGLRHGGAAAPILLTTGPGAGALAAAGALGWSTAELDDVSSAWDDALAGHVAPGGGHVPR